jgi:hypothetical protein
MPMNRQELAADLYRRTNGGAWEPRDPNHPAILELITSGYLRRVDGRCGFERFKDSMCAWTDAAKALFVR